MDIGRQRFLTFKASNGGGEGTINLCEVDHNGPQVARSDRVIAVSWVGPIKGVMPFCSDLGTGRYIDNGGG